MKLDNPVSFCGLSRSENMWFNKPFRFTSPSYINWGLIRILHLSISAHSCLRTTFAKVHHVFLGSTANIMLKLRAKHRNCSVVGCTNQHKSQHRSPAWEDRKAEWIKLFLMATSLLQLAKTCTCANYFVSDCFANLQRRTGQNCKQSKCKDLKNNCAVCFFCHLTLANTNSWGNILDVIYWRYLLQDPH